MTQEADRLGFSSCQRHMCKDAGMPAKTGAHIMAGLPAAPDLLNLGDKTFLIELLPMAASESVAVREVR